MVTFDMPYSVSGVTEKNYHGTGVIVDAKRGLVVIDRNTVPLAMGDVRITFNGTVEVPGKVDVHSPAAQSGRRVLRPAPDRRHAGARRDVRHQGARARATMCGSSGQRSDSKVMSERTQVASVDPVAFPLSRTLRFRDSNLEAINLVNAPADLDGVLADEKGDVLALWSSFAFETQRELEQVNRGIPADLVTEMIDAVSNQRPLYSFEAEFDVDSLADARKLGLTDAWVKRFEEHDAQRRQVLSHRPAGGRARRPRRCSSRAICCSPSTARSSTASAKSSAPFRSPRSRSPSGGTAPRRPCR